MGKRIGKIVDDTTTYYFYDGDNVLLELDDTATTQARYTASLGIDDIISLDRGGVTTFYHKDGLGSVTELSELSHSQVGSYKYDVFGSIRSQTGSINNPYLFTSRALDTESGLYYYRARYYNSSVGRFISRDPILYGYMPSLDCNNCITNLSPRGIGNVLELIVTPKKLHPYIYVTNSPTNLIDPFGYCECEQDFLTCLAKCIEKYRFSNIYTAAGNVLNAGLNKVVGDTGRVGAGGMPPHATSWQHKAGSVFGSRGSAIGKLA